MNRKTALILLFVFVLTLPNMSMIMLSIEKGVVHTEDYNLNHIITQTACKASIKSDPVTCRNLNSYSLSNHIHVVLKSLFIPKNRYSIINQFQNTVLLHTILPSTHLASQLNTSPAYPVKRMRPLLKRFDEIIFFHK
jgi:hypothetical protein